MDETEKRTLEVDILFAVMAAAGGTFWYLRKRKRWLSLRWPIVTATIKGHSVEQRNKGGEIPVVVFGLHVEFSYAIGAAVHKGRWDEEFPTREQAERQFENYLSMPFYGRYKPSKPADYYVDPYRDVRAAAS